MSALRVAALLAGALLAMYSPAILGRVDGITVAGVALITLTLFRMYDLRRMERITMTELQETPAHSPAFNDVKKILDFEEAHPNDDGTKYTRIRNIFNVSHTRYYQRLGQIVHTKEAVEYKPQVVSRIYDRAQRAAAARRARAFVDTARAARIGGEA